MSQRVEVLDYTQEQEYELPLPEVACKDILAERQLFQESTALQERFYGEMGVVRTELRKGAAISDQPAYYKDERQQLSGAYKMRGASFAVMRDPAGRYVTWSTGNHATSVGIAAGRVGAVAEVEGTRSMSSTKLGRVLATGATVRQHSTFYRAEQAAHTHEGAPGTVVIPPFGSPEVVAGQCTLGDELVEDLVTRGLAHKDVTIPVSVAGGGHIAGIALPVWEAKQAGLLGENVRVVAVQPEGNDTMRRALAKLARGEQPANLYAYDRQDKACDALAIGEASLSPDMMAIVGNPEFVAGFYTVAAPEIGRSMAHMEAELGGTVEPAGALAHAFACAYAKDLQKAGLKTTFILPVSGGNVSDETKRHYQAAVAQDNFRQQSRADAEREESVEEEIASIASLTAAKAEHDTGDDTGQRAKEPHVVRMMGNAVLRGYTAPFRQGLVTPRPL